MATPAQTVQFTDAELLINFYKEEGIPAFAIRQRGTLNFKYEGDDLDEGAARLVKICEMLLMSKTAAIYALCLYNNFGDEITDKTPVSLSNNFRFNEYGSQIGTSAASSGNSEVLKELQALRADVKKLQQERNEAENEDQNKLGVIGQIMEMEAVQPLLVAIGTRVAEWIAPAAVGELKRVSGIPGLVDGCDIPAEQMPGLMRSINRIYANHPDISVILEKLADISESSPTKFKVYKSMLMKMK